MGIKFIPYGNDIVSRIVVHLALSVVLLGIMLLMGAKNDSLAFQSGIFASNNSLGGYVESGTQGNAMVIGYYYDSFIRSSMD